MIGGKVIGEGVDGCVLANSMWPCESGSHGVPDAKSTHYVSKVVSVNDEESENLKMAARLLGHGLSSKYLAGIHGECKPANSFKPPSSKDKGVLEDVLHDMKARPKTGQACDVIQRKINKKIPLYKSSKVMFISKYDNTVSGWANVISNEKQSFVAVNVKVENAIPTFLEVLQKLYQNDSEQLIHIDLHTGNIFVRYAPLEFGIADFGRCVFRRNGEDPSQTFYGKFLLEYITRYQMYCQYSQTPLEVRLLNYCYKKKYDNLEPDLLVKGWATDPEVMTNENGFSDFIAFNRYSMITHLLTRILFISMVETIQAICKKIRLHEKNAKLLYNNMTDKERKVVEFILTRYSIIAPINTILQELILVYDKKRVLGSKLARFLEKAMLMPYDQEGSSLVPVLTTAQGSDLRVLWSIC